MPTHAPDSVRIVLAGGRRLVRAGLRALLEGRPGWTVAAECDRLDEAARVAARERPDFVIFDSDPDGPGGFDSLPRVREAAPASRVLVIAGAHEAELHGRAALLGARGVVYRECEGETLFRALEGVRSGELWFKRSLLCRLFTERAAEGARRDPEAEKIASLTAQERRVIEHLCEGLKNQQIADRLFVSNITVRHHLVRIYDKLGVSTRLELTVYAYRHGLAQPTAQPPPAS